MNKKIKLIKMSNRFNTEEIVLPRDYIKGEIFIDLGASVEDYLKSLKGKHISGDSQKDVNVFNFIAEFKEGYDQEMLSEEEKLVGDKLNIEYRRNKAVDIINLIKEGEDELKYIKDALSFDNTNKYVIYKLLKYYYDKKDETKFTESINEYKFCITKKLKLKKGNKETIINFENFYKINIPILEYEEHPYFEKIESDINDLRNFVVFLFKQFYHLGKSIYEIRCYLTEKDLTEILTVNFKVNGKKMCKLFFNNTKKEETLKKLTKVENKTKKNLLPLMENFLCRYLYSKEFEDFRNNQPVSYKYNLTFFYNYIIYYFYDIVIAVNESEKKLIFKKAKLLAYFTLINFHNLIFDNILNKKVPFNENINQLLQFLLLLESAEGYKQYYIEKNPFHLERFDSFLDSSLADKFVDNLKRVYPYLNIEKVSNKIVFKERKDKSSTQIEIKYQYYSKNLINCDKINDLWENIQFERFQVTNFFLEADLNYLKYLIKMILSSNLFKTIFQTYINVSSLNEYYFNDKRNIQDYIDRIIFLPFKVGKIGKYAITDRFLLSVLVCGYPEKEINTLYDYRLYRIIELSLRSIILGDHEPLHFIEGVYSLLSEGKISRFNSKTNISIDRRYFLEEILFGWVQNKNNPLDLSKFHLSQDIKYKNEVFMNKRIDLITAITLLNPEIYSKDLTYFRKSVFEITSEDFKKFSFDNLNPEYPEYRAYLQSVIEEKTIRDYCDCENISINASMKGESTSIRYIRFNHNKK